jgi:nitrous oxide reductase accessory protein NosL
LGDLIHYLESPSPHGAPRGVFVEAVETSANPTSIDTRERGWIAAPAAVYLTGIERPHVMGPGLVAYSSAQAASEAAQRYGGRAAAWRELPPLVLRTQD